MVATLGRGMSASKDLLRHHHPQPRVELGCAARQAARLAAALMSRAARRPHLSDIVNRAALSTEPAPTGAQGRHASLRRHSTLAAIAAPVVNFGRDDSAADIANGPVVEPRVGSIQRRLEPATATKRGTAHPGRVDSGSEVPYSRAVKASTM